uniref:Uncharacterized protein n=1 Tax=Triticum urartu TaxID=4572 RepID=A0A8R7TKK3_TRIUA
MDLKHPWIHHTHRLPIIRLPPDTTEWREKDKKGVDSCRSSPLPFCDLPILAYLRRPPGRSGEAPQS